jgi:hypothetical protein
MQQRGSLMILVTYLVLEFPQTDFMDKTDKLKVDKKLKILYHPQKQLDSKVLEKYPQKFERKNKGKGKNKNEKMGKNENWPPITFNLSFFSNF